MKMSNLFEGLHQYAMVTTHSLGNVIQKVKRIKDPSEIEGAVVTPEFLLRLTPIQMKAIELAVNNHDALVSSLEDVVDFEPEATKNAAILLKKLKGESNEN